MEQLNDSAQAAYESPDQVRELVAEAFLDTPDVYRAEAGKPRHFWPQDDQVVVYVSGLPADCAVIEAAIRDYTDYVGSDGCIRFPVREIRIEHESGAIKVIGDRKRISETRTLPRR